MTEREAMMRHEVAQVVAYLNLRKMVLVEEVALAAVVSARWFLKATA